MPFKVFIDIQEGADQKCTLTIMAQPKNPTPAEMRVFEATVKLLEGPKPGFDQKVIFPHPWDRCGWKLSIDYYILDANGEPVKCSGGVRAWAELFETANRIVRQDRIGACLVSTVFLGLDHNWSGSGDPILWETLVFNGPCNMEMNRCGGSREQAEAMHQKVLAIVQGEMGVTPEKKIE